MVRQIAYVEDCMIHLMMTARSRKAAYILFSCLGILGCEALSATAFVLLSILRLGAGGLVWFLLVIHCTTPGTTRGDKKKGDKTTDEFDVVVFALSP